MTITGRGTAEAKNLSGDMKTREMVTLRRGRRLKARSGAIGTKIRWGSEKELNAMVITKGRHRVESPEAIRMTPLTSWGERFIN